MRSPEEVRLVQLLAHLGLTHPAISRVSGVPRATVREWLTCGVPPRLAVALAGCRVCGAPRHEPARLPAPAYTYLLGLYLGDGCISTHPRGVFKLRISLDAGYPDVLDECALAIAEVMPSNPVGWRANRVDGRLSYVEIYSHSKQWPCLFPQHAPGRKHHRRMALEPWQEDLVRRDPRPLLRGLIHSDGSRHLNRVNGKGYVRYQFSNRSDDIRSIFCWACDLAGVRWTPSYRWTVSVSRRQDVALMDAFIGPKS